MGKINLLAPEIAALIAAGEVIERPASVIKELLENALDAGARSVEADVSDAGRTLVAVRDDGGGIEPDDLERLFIRHATSKIARADDLYAVRTLGFRGEALYSIGAVSDVVLRSRPAGGESGWELHLRGGERLDLRPASLPAGTSVEVRELFFNTPARRKFLRGDASEMKQVINTFLPYALLYPDRWFTLRRDGRTVVNLAPAADRRHRAAEALNLPVEALAEATRVFGARRLEVRLLIGDINVQRARGDLQFVFVNGRPVLPGRFAAVLNQVFRSLAPPGVFPFFALEIGVPPETLEVNIHPAKREVRLRDEDFLTGRVLELGRELLSAIGAPRRLDDAVAPPSGKTGGPARPASETGGLAERPAQGDIFGAPGPLEADAPLAEKLLSARYLGAFRQCYLMFEIPGALLVIDQHAAHERVVFEALRRQAASGGVSSQQLLVPVLLRLSPAEKVAWEAGRARLEELGFVTAFWDEDHLAVHGHPCLLPAVEAAMRSLLAGEDLARCSFEAMVRRACRGAVTAGRQLSAEEAAHLCRELAACEEPFTCPHGRPVVLELGEKTIRRYFRR